MTLAPRLSYFDFPFCRETFCTGRGSTSKEETYAGVTFRRYGRNIQEHTLVCWEKGADVGRIMRMLRDDGSRLKSMNFIHPPGPDVPLAKRSPEFFVGGDFDTTFRDRSSKTRQTVERACRGVQVVLAAPFHDTDAANSVFRQWVAWASTRHFMVFKGHYARWLELWGQGHAPAEAFLWKLLDGDGTPIGIFGGEWDPESGEAQVTVAKHTQALSSKALWVLGLRATMELCTPTLVHCGSTADALKLSLGFQPLPSWVVDCAALRAEVGA